jgi:hypothetical protein
VDLSGSWRFQLDSADAGENERWYERALAEKIQLPGSLQERGFGDEISTNTVWTGTLNDRSWFSAERYAPFRQPGNVKVPFWLQPEKSYVGVAWYQRGVTVPESSRDKRLVVSFERAHWATTLWLDDQKIGSQNGLGTPHEYDLGIAADEMGFYFQVECSAWSYHFNEGGPLDQWIYDESERIVAANGNHPSFLLMAASNEAGGPDYEKFLGRWVDYWKRKDARRLHSAGSGWPNVPENDFDVTGDSRAYPVHSAANGGNDGDYRAFLAKRARPIVSPDGKDWGSAVAKGEFAANDSLKTVEFAAPITARWLKLQTLSGHADGPWASLAELNIFSHNPK